MVTLKSGSSVRRWWALGALMLGILTVGFDATILNVALPTLTTAVGAGTRELQWIVDAYILVFAGLLLPMGTLGDRYGRKRLMIIGLTLFAAASVFAAYAGGAGALIAARAVMGVGAAILTPIALAVLPVLFPPDERARAVAFAMMAMGLGLPLGPIIGGYLLDHFWWGSIFLVNVPVALIALVAVALLVPESKDPTPRRADVVGGALSTAGLVLLVYGVIEAPARGWTDALVLATALGGLVLLAAFVAWERVTAEPMIDLSLFGRPRFLWGTVAATLAGFALFGLLFVLPQYLQGVLGYDAFGVGVRLLPLMAGLVVGAKFGESVAARLGAKIPVAAGLLVVTAGLAIGATTTVDSGYGLAAAWLSVFGFGVGVALAPAMDAVLGELPPERTGAGTAVSLTLRQVGAALGVAVLGSVLASAYAPEVSGPAAAYVHAMTVVFTACAVVCGVGAVAVGALLPARASASDRMEA